MDKTKLTEMDLLGMARDMAVANESGELVAYFEKKISQLENKKMKDKERKSKHKGEVSDENKGLLARMIELLDGTSEEEPMSALEISHSLEVSGPKVTHLYGLATDCIGRVKVKNKVHYFLIPKEEE